MACVILGDMRRFRTVELPEEWLSTEESRVTKACSPAACTLHEAPQSASTGPQGIGGHTGCPEVLPCHVSACP